MRQSITFLLAIMVAISGYAQTFQYKFTARPLAQALSKISDEHPEIEVNFIYDELENYKSTASINTNDPYEALRKTIGLNPVTILRKGNSFYIEALQHGKFQYSGRVMGTDKEPVVAATVFILEPKDSTVITYGITDVAGRFVIPCDRQGVIAKFSCLGYHTLYRKLDSFSAGTIIMPEKTVALKEVKVEGDNSFLYSDKSVYIPTSRQKNAPQSGGELLNRMGIPQLKPNIGDKVETMNGQSVAIFVDNLPANENDLKGMRMSDVKKVEYYDYPTDPRFEGKEHVINFIMQHYEYGGYVKGYVSELMNEADVPTSTVNAYAKLQRGKMTYDIASGFFGYVENHIGEDKKETYRLPQEDGSIREFERNTTLLDSRNKVNEWWGSMKALYNSDKTTLSNMLSVSFYRNPKNRQSGAVDYTPSDYPSGIYSSTSSNRINSFSYYGYWRFILPHSNTLVINPSIAYSHTGQFSIYEETDAPIYQNGAKDSSSLTNIYANLSHSFGKYGILNTVLEGMLYHTNTSYSGTSDIEDHTNTIRLGPGLKYSLTTDKIHTQVGGGINWDKSSYCSISEMSAVPWADFSFQYKFNRKNSANATFNFKKSVPSSSYRSESVVQSNPLMSYTGNPKLRPYSSFDIGLTYVFIPSNNYSISAYSSAWFVRDRYYFDYEATPTGILRSIKQPGGGYSEVRYGVFGSAKYFNGRLQLSANLRQNLVYNGDPYKWTKSYITYSLFCQYFVGDFYFLASYTSPQAYAPFYDCMSSTWTHTKDQYGIQMGWSNSNWNLRLYVQDFFHWNWVSATTRLDSEYYSFTSKDINSNRHAYVSLSATYTFGFGKKVERGNEAYQQNGAGSGILK